MSIPSNLYAEKIFSEHPIALWPLDDQADYISLISEADRNMTNGSKWTITEGSATIASELGPFEDSTVIEISGVDPGTDPGKTVTLLSKNIVNLNTLDQNLETMAISMFFYSESADIDSVQIGFRYTDSGDVDVLETIPISTHFEWGFLSQTFTVPNKNSNFKLLIKINYTKSTTPGASYKFKINGLTVGQRSEEFHRTSLGVSSITIPSNIDIPSTSVVEAFQYGMAQGSSYYMVTKNSLCAKNFGVPLVYGSDSVTTLYPNGSSPSMIVPGYGFLNESGQYHEKTLEAWLRINSGSTTPKRIIGPLNSEDGLYVDGPFLCLKVGNNSGAHFVGEWGRPMLIDIRIASDSASLLVNGEQVISLFYKTDTLSLPSKYNPDNNKDQDWIGFYAPSDIYPIQVDAVAIYSYAVPEVVAKRRFVYGQGVEFPNNINASYNTTSVVADYQFANYANNYSYPDIGSWEIGILENLSFDGSSISVPKYTTPIVQFNNRTNAEWYVDLKAAQADPEDVNTLITLRPNSNWDTVDGYILFENFNVLDQDVHAFYGTFEKTDSSTEKQTLIKIYSDTNTNYFEISMTGSIVKYEINYNNTLTEIVDAQHDILSGTFSVGFNLNDFVKSYGYDLQAFFGNRNTLKMLVGGNRDFSNTFTGEIYYLGFCTEKNYNKLKSHFDETGNIKHDTDMTGEVPSYDLIVKQTLSGFKLDVAVESSWKDYIPLTYFSKYVTDANNNKYYSMDLLQFNIGYPESDTFINTTYTNIAGDTISVNAYDTTSSPVRTYITFESSTYDANRLDADFAATVPALSNGIVEPGSDWRNTRYEVINGSIIYPPSDVDIQTLAIATHIEFKVHGILSNPVKIRKLHLSSLALDDVSGHSIGTKFGVPVRPYTKLGVYMDYKKRNPFAIYKGNTPYLHLTKQSGFRLRGDQKIGVSRGLTTPINQGKSATYKVGAMQMSIRLEDPLFPENPVEVFELESTDSYIKFYMVATDVARKRGRIYAINTTTGELQENLNFYLNGKLVRSAIINPREWYILGIQFGSKPDFASSAGAFRITGPLTTNNISHYQYTASQEQQSAKTRLWSNILAGESTIPWSNWLSSTWRDVLFVVTTERTAIDPSTIYKIYTGTNKIIVSDDKKLSLVDESYKLYLGTSWQSQTLNAV